MLFTENKGEDYVEEIRFWLNKMKKVCKRQGGFRNSIKVITATELLSSLHTSRGHSVESLNSRP